MNCPFVEIGVIQRTHGVNGEFQVSWSNDFYFDQQDLESVFLEIEGIPIPFFVRSLRPKGEGKAIILFDDIQTIADADEFVGLKLLLPEDQLPEPDDDDLTLEMLVGYSVLSDDNQAVGTITAVEDYSVNTVFELLHPSGKRIMIPAADDLILEVDPDARTVTMHIPEGLLDVYLQE